jgi:hypothetical protein
MKKILVPGIVGGIVYFLWSFISHMATPIGQMGIKTVDTNEDAVISSLKTNMQQPGFYMLPGAGMLGNPTAEQTAAVEAKYAAGPTAVVVYNPTGSPMMSGGQLGRQFLFTLISALIAAFIVSATAASLTTRAVMVALMGAFSWLMISLPQWNWYRFPAAFVIGVGIDNIVGWLIAGFAIAWMIGRAEK